MIKILCILILLSSLSGCSYFTKKFESLANSDTKQNPHPSVSEKNNYCAPASRLQYISEDEHTLKFYRSLHPVLFEKKDMPFVQKAVMLSLVEMSKRPDESSPYSRLQIYLKLNGKTYYYDFIPKNLEDETKMPFLRGLDFLVQNFIPKQNLKTIASILDTAIPKTISVSSEFESFLRTNQKDLLKNDDLTNTFLKGDETLTRYETFNRLSYKNIIEQYSTPLISKLEDYEFEKNRLDANKSQSQNYQANCNFDLSKELSPKEDISGAEAKKSHYIGIAEGQDFFLAVTSSILQRPLKSSPNLAYLLKARPSRLPLPICEFKGINQEVVLFSSNGRNPLQHLQHLVAYEIDQIDSSFTLNELLNFSRHLFLSNPDRILYESKRGRKVQLDFFLAMNFPIYHVENLGNIFGHAAFKNEKGQDSSLHIDDRSSARLWCGQ